MGTTFDFANAKPLQMAHLASIDDPVENGRTHYIPEWATRAGLKQADIVRETGADKGLVSRWFSGTIPSRSYLGLVAKCVGADEPADLFRHPDEFRLKKILENRPPEEREKILKTLEVAFPR